MATSGWVYDDFGDDYGSDEAHASNIANSIAESAIVDTAPQRAATDSLFSYGNWSSSDIPSQYSSTPLYDERDDLLSTPDSLPDLEPPTPTEISPAIPPPPQIPPPRLVHSYVTDNKFHRSNISLTTRETPNHTYYLDFRDVFNYVTLGASFSDEYYDVLNNLICKEVYSRSVDELGDESKYYEKNVSYNGRVFSRPVVLYNWQFYGIIASKILEWTSNNPEKVANN
tara:strand:+ start:114 stop:794 length:681 start_codon:yes stop_codon:yes gene_type:complete